MNIQQCNVGGKDFYLQYNANKLFTLSLKPFNENFVITCSAAKGNLTVIDAQGKVVKSLSCKEGEKQLTIDMKGFASGVYLIKYENDNQISTQKIVKQ